MRTKPISLTALTAAGLGLLLTGCGNAPGSVADDPLALKLVEAEAKTQAWGGAELDMILSGAGQLAGQDLPCISMSSRLEPERFLMQIVTDNTGSDGDCSPASEAYDTKQLWYSDGVMYVGEPSPESIDSGNDPDDAEASCSVTATSHQVSAELAAEFADKQTQQAKMADLMSTATEISGDDTNIHAVLDTESVAGLGDVTIPSGADPDDINTSIDVVLDSAGALHTLDLTVEADGTGLEIHTSYAKPDGEITVPEPACVTDGEPYTSMSQLESALT